MHEAFLAREDLDERAELLDGRDATFVDLADADFGRHRLDVLDARHHLLGVDARDRAEAAVFDADAHLELLLHAADVLARRADDHADLLLRHGQRLEARRVRAQLSARLAQRLQHLAQNVQTTEARLLKRLRHDLTRETVALDVHLQRGDAAPGADDLEVHVAARVLAAEDVGQNRVLLALHHEAHRHAGDRLLDRDAGIHHRERRGARGRHRRAAVRLQDLAGDADRVGELFARRQNRLDAAFSECAVADLAATWRARALHFTDAERREVVVQQEALLPLGHQAIDDLLIVHAAERHDAERLRLAAREQDRSVDAREHADFDRDRADRHMVATVGATAREDRLTFAVLDDAADDLAERLAPLHLLTVRAAGRGRERGRRGFLRGLDRHAALLLGAWRQRRCAQLLAELRLDRVDELLIELRRRERSLLAARERTQLFDQRRDVARRLVAELEGFEHDGFGDFLGAGLDHHDRVLAARNREVELVLGRLDVAPERVDDELVVHHTDAAHAERRAMRDGRQRQRCEARDRGDHVRIVLTIGREHLRQDLDLGLVAVWEHRPHAAVDQAATEDLLRRRAAFALEEAAGDHARGRALLAVFDREREEVDVIAGLLALRRREDDRVAVVGDDCAVGLTGHAAGLENQGAAADFALHADRLRDAAGAHRGWRAGARGLARSLCGRGFRLLGAAAAGALRRGASLGAALWAAGCGRVVVLLLACHSRSRVAASAAGCGDQPLVLMPHDARRPLLGPLRWQCGRAIALRSPGVHGVEPSRSRASCTHMAHALALGCAPAVPGYDAVPWRPRSE